MHTRGSQNIIGYVGTRLMEGQADTTVAIDSGSGAFFDRGKKFKDGMYKYIQTTGSSTSNYWWTVGFDASKSWTGELYRICFISII